jgi:hypothetical protein
METLPEIENFRIMLNNTSLLAKNHTFDGDYKYLLDPRSLMLKLQHTSEYYKKDLYIKTIINFLTEQKEYLAVKDYKNYKY